MPFHSNPPLLSSLFISTHTHSRTLTTHSLSIIVFHPDKSLAAQAEVLPLDFSAAINRLYGHLACILAHWAEPWKMPLSSLSAHKNTANLPLVFSARWCLFYRVTYRLAKLVLMEIKSGGVFGFWLTHCLFWQACMKQLSLTTAIVYIWVFTAYCAELKDPLRK